jgi:CRP-like cAMP-binding protein
MSEIVAIKKNDVLFEEGDFPEHMYIVKSGEISLYITNGNVEHIVAVAGPGHLIGEMSLFDNKFRSASAKATKDSELIRLPYKFLEKELEKLPEWVRATLKTLAEKLRIANEKLKKQ